MVERGFGRIVAISSTAGLRGGAYVSAYSAVEARLVGLVRSLALETVKNGVTVNAVCPGYIDTDMARTARRPHRREDRPHAASRRWPDMLKDLPIGRLVRPEEVAAAVLYFCSAEPRAVTGTTLAIAGGEL